MVLIIFSVRCGILFFKKKSIFWKWYSRIIIIFSRFPPFPLSPVSLSLPSPLTKKWCVIPFCSVCFVFHSFSFRLHIPSLQFSFFSWSSFFSFSVEMFHCAGGGVFISHIQTLRTPTNLMGIEYSKNLLNKFERWRSEFTFLARELKL